MVRSGFWRFLKIAAAWPWAPEIVTAWDCINALAQALYQYTNPSPAIKEPTWGLWNRRPVPPAGRPVIT
jgi:hypothetical protein